MSTHEKSDLYKEGYLAGKTEYAARLAEAERDAAYLKWRLNTIIPLFQEARDALCAIPLAIAKLRGLDLTLGDRMDKAGTATRADFDAAMSAASQPGAAHE